MTRMNEMTTDFLPVVISYTESKSGYLLFAFFFAVATAFSWIKHAKNSGGVCLIEESKYLYFDDCKFPLLLGLI